MSKSGISSSSSLAKQDIIIGVLEVRSLALDICLNLLKGVRTLLFWRYLRFSNFRFFKPKEKSLKNVAFYETEKVFRAVKKGKTCLCVRFSFTKKGGCINEYVVLSLQTLGNLVKLGIYAGAS